MKDGQTYLAHKAEHAVDLESGAFTSSPVYRKRPFTVLALLVGRAPPCLGYAQLEDWRCGRDGYQAIDHRLSRSLGLVV